MTIHLGPYLSNNLPISGARIPFNALAGSKIKPALSVKKARPACKYMGNTSIEDRMTIMQRATMRAPIPNIGYLKARRSSIGVDIFNWRTEKRISATRPMSKGIKAVELVQPPAPSPALLEP